jgi:hypothetical protein
VPCFETATEATFVHPGTVIITVLMKTRAFFLGLIVVLSPLSAYVQSQAERPTRASILLKAGKLLDVRKGSYIAKRSDKD